MILDFLKKLLDEDLYDYTSYTEMADHCNYVLNNNVMLESIRIMLDIISVLKLHMILLPLAIIYKKPHLDII